MNSHKRCVAVGVFTDHTQADRAVAELKKAGFRDDQIGVVGRDWRGQTSDKKTEGTLAEEGAIAGALTGATGGALIGLGILAGVIPAIGPVIAGGVLGCILANAAGGAAIVGVLGALLGLGLPEEEAHYYESEFKSGRTIVTVKSEDRYDEAMATLRRYGGWDRTTMHATPAAGECATAPASTMCRDTAEVHAGQKIALKEEELHARKQPVQTGEVRVRKEIITEHKTLDVPIQREEVVIERHAVAGQPATHADFRAGEEIRIPVKEEQVQVVKTPVVKEEVTVSKQKVQDTEHVAGTVRKEEVRIEREGDVNVRGSGADRKDKGPSRRNKK